MHRGLEALVDRELSSVEFVRDYVQIRFDGPCLSAYTSPTIRTHSGREFVSTTAGYADALIGLIGKTVNRAYQSPTHIEIEFEGGAILAISLKDEDRRADEAATLIDGATLWSW